MKLLLTGALLLAGAAQAAREVAVAGKCEIKTSPDRGRLQLRMEKTAPQVDAAVTEVSTRIEKAKAAIRKLNLADLELHTPSYQVNEHREWEKDKNVFKGYRASLGLEVTTSEIKRLGEVMGIAAHHGLTGTDGLQTFLSTEKAQAEYLRCLDIAAKDARKKAARLAETLGASLGEVERIAEESARQEHPRPMMMEKAVFAADASAARAPQVEVADQAFSVTLQVVFRLK